MGDSSKKRAVDVQFAVGVDEAQLPKLVCEYVDPRPSRPNRFCQSLMGDFGNRTLRFSVLAIARKQQESPRQLPFAGVEVLNYQGLLDSGVAWDQTGDETIRERSVLVKEPQAFRFFHAQQ